MYNEACGISGEPGQVTTAIIGKALHTIHCAWANPVQ